MSKVDNSLDALDVVGIILVVLKSIGVQPVASWSWWLVLSPFWIYIGALALIALLVWCVKDSKKEKK